MEDRKVQEKQEIVKLTRVSQLIKNNLESIIKPKSHLVLT